MHDEYLWDRSGEADPEIQKLEAVLAVYRSRDRSKHAAPRI